MSHVAYMSLVAVTEPNRPAVYLCLSLVVAVSFFHFSERNLVPVCLSVGVSLVSHLSCLIMMSVLVSSCFFLLSDPCRGGFLLSPSDTAAAVAHYRSQLAARALAAADALRPSHPSHPSRLHSRESCPVLWSLYVCVSVSLMSVVSLWCHCGVRLSGVS